MQHRLGEYSMNDAKVFHKAVQEICRSYGFISRGNTLFRIHGDGVLQVVKSEKIRHWNEYDIYFGLLSMYGELRAEWFTAKWCITRYPALSFIGKRSAVYLENRGEYYTTGIVTAEKQFDVLENMVIPFLNSITTQTLLAQSLCQLDEMMCSKIIWHDSLKFTPFLHSGNRDMASKVIQSILNQHSEAAEHKRYTMTEQEFQNYLTELQVKDRPYYRMLTLAQDGDEKSIQEYLEANYSKNREYARFILRAK